MVEGFFYNSVKGDRKYNGNSVNVSKRPFYKDGVFAGQLEVTAKDGEMAVIVEGGEKTGFAWINSHTIHNTTPLKLDVSQSSGTLSRIDRVVVRNDETERKPSIYILEGSFSSEPKAPELINTDAIQEKCLAEIYVKAGAVEITQADITDTRANETLCGFVASQFKEFDFSQWQKQFDKYFSNMKEKYETEYSEFTGGQESAWKEWFENKREELDEEVAGNLQNQIDNIAELPDAAVNEIFAKNEEIASSSEKKFSGKRFLRKFLSRLKMEVIDVLDDVLATTEDNMSVGCKAAQEMYEELNGNLGGLKYKIYQVPARNWTKGSNTILTLDIDASKVREINALIYNSAVSYLLPISPFNERGEYMATFGANIRLNMQTGQLILSCGGTWNGYALHVVVGYAD